MRSRVLTLLAVLACAGAAHGGGTTPPASSPVLPPVASVFTASREYPVAAVALTNHAGWTETVGYANVAQTVKLYWKVDPGGEAIARGRPAWDPSAPWRELGHWGRGTGQPQRGETTFAVEGPTLVSLRVRAAKFPRSGIARLRAEFVRKTAAVLRGSPGARKRPVIIAEGYDPFNNQDWNDSGWQDDPTLAQLVSQARRKYELDPWLLDWGDGAASLEQQAADFADIARQVREWNGGRRDTVAVGISMGAVSLRHALAGAAGQKEGLGVRKYVSVNGPHRGAWINPELMRFLLKRVRKGEERSRAKAPRAEDGNGSRSRADGGSPDRRREVEDMEQLLLRRALGSAAAQELLIGGDRHQGFYRSLRSLGRGGYDPEIPRVAFSNGTLVREGNDLAELLEGEEKTVHRVSMRPLWLPLWITLHKTPRDFRYGAYPGELLPADLRRPVRTHVRFLGVFRFDFRGRWETIPTFIPTHSALDFPEELSGSAHRFRYAHWRQSAFERFYVSPGRNLAHDATQVPWINPVTGKGAPAGENAVLHEISR